MTRPAVRRAALVALCVCVLGLLIDAAMMMGGVR